MKQVFLYGMLFLVLIVTIFAIQMNKHAKESTSVPKIVIRIGHGHSSEHSYRKGLEHTARILAAESGGMLSLEFFPNEQLGSERQMQEMVGAGSLDMTVAAVLNYYDSIFALLEFPFLYAGRDHVRQVIGSGLFSSLESLLLKHGVRSLGAMEVGFRMITSNKPIRTPSDLKGCRIRTPENPAQIETIRAFGATPIPMSFTQIYEALENGVVDGQENPLENIYDAKLYEVQKYVAVTRHIYNLAFVLISERLWLRLTPEQQRILKSAISRGCEYQMEYAAARETQLENQLKEKGMIFTYPERDSFELLAGTVFESSFFRSLEPEASRMVDAIRQLSRSTTRVR